MLVAISVTCLLSILMSTQSEHVAVVFVWLVRKCKIT